MEQTSSPPTGLPLLTRGAGWEFAHVAIDGEPGRGGQEPVERGPLGGQDDQAEAARGRGLAVQVAVALSHREPEFVIGHFPTIHEKLLGLGIDMTKEPIPVVPAQHYTCGGVLVDRHGRTDAPGLYAAGEVTQSGLHGANRLASNSLTESLVAGRRAGDLLGARLPEPGGEPVATTPTTRPVPPSSTASTAGGN